MKLSPNKFIIILIWLISAMAGLSLSLYRHPLPHTRLEAQPYHHPIQFVSQLKNNPHPGKAIFKEYCASCHAAEPLIDIQAPRINDKTAWKNRRKRGITSLLKTTIQGIGAMPARGGCFECSDTQLRAAVYYMINQ